MKKLFVSMVLFLLISFCTDVSAATLKLIAETQNDFSTLNPPKELALKIKGTYYLKNNELIPDGTIISGSIVKIQNAKRGKRNAYAYMQLKHYKLPNGNAYEITNPDAIVKLTAHTTLDWKEKGLDTAASAAGYLVENITYPINFVRGVIKPIEGESRIASGMKTTYNKSMFSYFSKGKELVLTAGNPLTVTIKYNADKEETTK